MAKRDFRLINVLIDAVAFHRVPMTAWILDKNGLIFAGCIRLHRLPFLDPDQGHQRPSAFAIASNTAVYAKCSFVAPTSFMKSRASLQALSSSGAAAIKRLSSAVSETMTG